MFFTWMLLWRPLPRISGWEVVVGRRITTVPVLRAAWVAVPRVLPVILIHGKSVRSINTLEASVLTCEPGEGARGPPLPFFFDCAST